jgi:hypothetical protein
MEMKVASSDELQRTLVGKSAGSKRREDGAFDVRVRLHSLTREDRAWLEQVFR